jgi:hypothetical protein
MAAGQRDQTVDGLIRYRVARVKLADAKGHDLPAYSAEFGAPQQRRDSRVAQEIAEHLRPTAERDREAGQ